MIKTTRHNKIISKCSLLGLFMEYVWSHISIYFSKIYSPNFPISMPCYREKNLDKLPISFILPGHQKQLWLALRAKLVA